jgi:two-component system chemotaxis sensor kinase CheA
MNPANPSSTFLIEAEDLLDKIQETALELRPGEAVGEPIHRLFRAFHTIKGSGAMFGFDAVAQFTHHVETVLDKVREGEMPVSNELISLILASKDRIKALLDSAQGGPLIPPDVGEQEIVSRLNALLPGAAASSPALAHRDPSLTQVPALQVEAAEESSPAATPKITQTFHIRFRPNPSVMACGTNPVLLLNELRALGPCSLVASTDAIPCLEELQPDQCYLAWEVTLHTDRGLDAVKDVFIFVEDGSEISIETSAAQNPSAGQEAVSSAHTGDRGSALPEPSPTPLRPRQATRTSQEAPSTDSRRPVPGDSVVRVPSERLDRLVTLVGEMVMNQARLTQVAASANLPSLSGPVEELERLVAELRDNVLGIRMMPIGRTFSRYKRLVHDLSAELGKEIDLSTEGAETELDKTVLDHLADPLVHLIRNCIDHGIEPAEVRAQTGKPRRGTILLAAAHTGSTVVITIRDDGRGLDPEAIRAKALEKKLIAPAAVLTREEIFNLVFLPGLSTAKQITSVSGRGVGMDVVRRQIDALRGSIQLASTVGKGTTVSLTLPLTLAIIDGLLIEIGPDQFIIPMAAVAENVELTRAERCRNNGRNLITVRGELISYLRLREVFEADGEQLDLEKVVIIHHGGERVGLVVDRVLGSRQTVIQSLGRFYRDIEVASGATIMGDGRVAIILDPAGLIRHTGRPDARGPLKKPADFRSRTNPQEHDQQPVLESV